MRVQLKKNIIGRSLLALLAIAITLPSMAHNRTPSIAHPPAFDRYAVVDDDQQDERELVVIDRATLRHFDDVSRIELPAESIASQLETRIRSITLTAEHASIDVFPVRQKLASGSLELFEENNLNEHRELGLKTRWAIGNARARWYDPSTGTFLTPDPLGYGASGSNLYSFAHGDPVNGRDPTGLADVVTKRLSAPSEKITALDLVKAGWKVLRGETGVPHNTYGPGEDVLAVKKGVSIVMSPTGEMVEVAGEGTVLFVDDKNLGRTKAYSATALNENFETGGRVRKARELVESAEQLTEEERTLALKKLRSGDITKAIMAGAEESNVRGVGPKLLKKGIGFLPKTNLGKGILALTVVSIALSDDPAQATVNALTLGGPDLNADEQQSVDDMLILTAVADEINRRRFIGPPTPPHLQHYGTTGGW